MTRHVAHAAAPVITDTAQLTPAMIAHARAEQEARDAALLDRPRLGPAPADPHRTSAGLAGFGRPLPAPLRRAEEIRLGADLSGLRLHDDAPAGQRLQHHHARALTEGADIAMRPADARIDTPDRLRLIRHEIAHAVQQARPGAAPATQYEGDGQGIGRSPPDAPFVTMDSTAAEDDFVLFGHDSAELTPAARRALAAAASGYESAGELVVHVHGYASPEGEAEYNSNLSAHRAVAIRDELAPLLPEGTRFTLYAHGETEAFGNPAQNRRAGIDFITPDDGSFLSSPGPLSLFPRPRPGFHLLPPGDLSLTPPGASTLAESELPPRLPSAALGLPSPDAPLYGPVLPPSPQLDLFRAPPPIFDTPFNYGALAGSYARRGLSISPRDGQNMEDHFEHWRLRFFRMGLSVDLATQAAQLSTDLAFGMQIANEYPTRFELEDRQMGTSPRTITIFNERMAIGIYEFFRDMSERRDER